MYIRYQNIVHQEKCEELNRTDFIVQYFCHQSEIDFKLLMLHHVLRICIFFFVAIFIVTKV